ncbi:MAG: c-type cytochrome, partial [Hyphomicrobiaceae bacterium]|nr:c-type cytochrome [Hyphomicrobiaceae bacterium]
CAAQAAAQEEAKPADGVSPGEALVNKRCAQCHSLVEGKNGNGPSLFRIVGREAAVVPGFKYSRALRRMAADESLKWSEENLTAFLTRPSLLVPGTRMAFPGVKKEEDLAALVAWIKANSGPPPDDS